jgi:hypothetical protein
MRVSLGSIEHVAFVTFMMTFAGMAYMDYARDGDRLSLALAVAMGALTALSTYLWFLQRSNECEGDDES